MDQNNTATRNSIGRTSMWLGLSPWIAYVIVFVCVISGMPGFGWGSPVGVLVGLLIMLAPPAALIGGIVALCKGETRTYAWAAIVIGAVSWTVLGLLPLLCL